MHDVAAPRPIPLQSLVPWALVAVVLLLLLYLIGLDQGALSRSGNLLHEVMHDGRHLLGAPCH